MHIVAIHRNGTIDGYQLRMGTGGPGNTKFVASKKHGGSDEARRAVEQLARELGSPMPARAGGSVTGLLLKSSATRVAGVRFIWTPTASTPVLRVIASWIDNKGRARNTSYSVERNGLDSALDKAIKARTSAGAPPPDRDALLRMLREVYRTGAAG